METRDVAIVVLFCTLSLLIIKWKWVLEQIGSVGTSKKDGPKKPDSPDTSKPVAKKEAKPGAGFWGWTGRLIFLGVLGWAILAWNSYVKWPWSGWSSNTSQSTTYAQSHRPTAPAGKQRYTKTIVAKPGAWSEVIALPRDSWCQITPEAEVRVKAGLGKKEWDYSPSNPVWLGENVSILDSVFQFKPKGDKEVNIKVDWEAK
ncbi:MAG: hypothetical protein HYT48_02190 [Candidatus Vogelbacteria bacterium]|nr:hypothetical protein [Candidatus Vogelbacteria bacterium]